MYVSLGWLRLLLALHPKLEVLCSRREPHTVQYYENASLSKNSTVTSFGDCFVPLEGSSSADSDRELLVDEAIWKEEVAIYLKGISRK